MVLGPGKEVGVHCCRGKGIQSESWDAGMLQAWGGFVGSLCTDIGCELGQQVSCDGEGLSLSFLSPASEGTCGAMSIHP